VTTDAALCEVLPWDSEFFGVKVARVRGDLTPSQLNRADDWCRREGVDVAYLNVPIEETATIRVAAELGFHFVDVRVVLGWRRGYWRPEPRISGTVIRPHRPSDVGTLEQIAVNAYRDSRFYVDDHFPRERCDALYAAWVRRCCAERDSTVFVAERDGDVAGYLAHRVDPSLSTATIALVGVAEGYRGHGIGVDLIGASLATCVALGVQRVQVATQGRNVAAQRMYQRAGMTTDAMSAWLHKWYRDP
jgi:dTDP-4-amino-4,6-dideoxy-D-galactose acyltransferase